MIRIVNVETGRRLLFKGMDSEALDMEFAFTKEPVLLAFIEETALYVIKIEDLGDKIESTLVFKLLDPIGHTPICDKVAWCPYVPESKYENDDYASQLLVWSRINVFQCYSVHDVSTNYGVSRLITYLDKITGSLCFKNNLIKIGLYVLLSGWTTQIL